MSSHKPLNSAIYKGTVRHRRFVPCKHEFSYKLYMLYLDLDEVETIFKQHWFSGFNGFNLVSFKRKDYFQPETENLKQAVMSKVTDYAKEQGVALEDIKKVTMLTHARYFNIIFNPVSFYYCFDEQDQLIAIMAEITNTPWGERYSYVLLVGAQTSDRQFESKGDKHHAFHFDKEFHVSPFNPMNMAYNWVLSTPDERLNIHMDNTMGSHGEIEKHFDATLILHKKQWQTNFAKSLIQYPFMTVKVMWGIYWQALKLWLKKVPFYDHPNSIDKPITDQK